MAVTVTWKKFSMLEMGNDKATYEEISATSPANIYYRVQWDTYPKKGLTQDKKVLFCQTVVPKKIKARLMCEVHEGTTSGHFHKPLWYSGWGP